jgi:COMPASS component SWD3
MWRWCARVIIGMALVALVAGCGKAEPTAMSVPLTDTPVPATAAPAAPTQTPILPTEPPVLPAGPAKPTSTETATPLTTETPLPTDTPIPLRTHTGSGGSVIAYCYQPRSGSSFKQIYAVNADGSDDRRLIEAPVGLNHHDWSPDAQTMAAVGYASQSTWSIYVFDLVGGELTRLTNTPGVWDSEPSWSPDGTRIAFTRIYPEQDEREEVWIMDADGGDQHWIGLEGFAAKWSPDGSRFIYTSNRSGNYEIYTSNIDGTDERQLTSTSANESFPTWSPDGSKIAYSASTGKWNTIENTKTYELYVMDADGSNVRQLTDNAAYDSNPRWSPDGSLIVFSSDLAEAGHWEVYVMSADGSNMRRVTNTPSSATAINPVWRPETNAPIPEAITADTAGQVELLSTLSGHSDKVYTVAFSGDGSHIASVSPDKTIKLWDVPSGQEVHTFSISEVGMNDIALSPDGHLLASSEAIWDVESKQVVHALDRGKFGSVAFSPDGSTLAVAWFNQPIALWDVASWQEARALDNQAGNLAMSIEFSPDGTLLAVGGHLNGTVTLWDVENGQIVRTFAHDTRSNFHGVAFSPDGQLLASAATEGTVKIWDVASGQLVHTMPGTGCYDVTFSPDGSLLATAGCDRAVKLWDAASWQLLRTLTHADTVMSVVFSPDSTLLASGSYDQQIYLWGIPR